jgi:hypothetical protein
LQLCETTLFGDKHHGKMQSNNGDGGPVPKQAKQVAIGARIRKDPSEARGKPTSTHSTPTVSVAGKLVQSKPKRVMAAHSDPLRAHLGKRFSAITGITGRGAGIGAGRIRTRG